MNDRLNDFPDQAWNVKLVFPHFLYQIVPTDNFKRCDDGEGSSSWETTYDKAEKCVVDDIKPLHICFRYQ